MPEIRALRDEDVPEVAVLQEKAFRGRDGPGSPGLHAYLRQVFLENPWRELGPSSLVRVSDEGRITGFLGVIPRPMLFRGEPIVVAVCNRLAALPDARDRMGGLLLLRACLAGAQDLSVTDGANLEARRVWQSLRGETCLARSLTWTRPLRPVAYARHLALRHTRQRWLSASLRLAARPLDAWLARRARPFGRVEKPALEEEELSEAVLLENLGAMLGQRALQPVYDARSLGWLVRFLRDNHDRGSFRSIALRDATAKLAGWYLYYRNPGGVNEVLQLAALPRHAAAVCDHVLWRAHADGAVAASGRLEPALLEPLVRARPLWSLPEGSVTLFHAKDPELASALQRGDAWFTALEGELWLRSPLDEL